MSDAPTPETDAEHMRILNDMEIPIESECFAMVTFARRLERERDEARGELKLEQSRVWAAMLIIQKSDDERDSLRARVAELEEALIRLRDCDWTISLPDRMDAVREIARKALAKKEADHG